LVDASHESTNGNMLATFIIGLREGLEAALIIGIIATFLRNNGKSLLPMWLGVALAICVSIAVGVALALVERALPQAAQEGLETIIGLIAVACVTIVLAGIHGLVASKPTLLHGLNHLPGIPVHSEV